MKGIYPTRFWAPEGQGVIFFCMPYSAYHNASRDYDLLCIWQLSYH